MSKKSSADVPSADFDRLASAYGIPPDYEDLQGEVRAVPKATRRRILDALDVPDDLDAMGAEVEKLKPPQLKLNGQTSCYLPEFLSEGPIWGISLQLYELRSRRNWGIGDFADLRQTCGIAASAGADFIGLSPLHALFLGEPERCSPYSPSSRIFLSPLYIAVDEVDGFEAAWPDPQELERLREQEVVDYRGVTRLKLNVLRRIWNAREPNRDAIEYENFKNDRGDDLRRHALFEALSLHLTDLGHGSGWSQWPSEFREWDSPAVRHFAEMHAGEVEFHTWLQWLAAKQLAEVTEEARRLGMRVGLYFDLAVGEAPDGSSTWGTPDLALPGLRVGAPPDVFSTSGQDWGLVALSPMALQARKMRPYRDLIDASMRFAGALRIDHAMGIWQLFLLPEGETPAVGGYLRYPFADMVAALASVSHARRSIVIGEDLGNVPDGFREVMEEAQILGYRVLYFEEAAPEGFDVSGITRLSLACLSTHDLPPLIGWWRGDDIDLALKFGLTEQGAAVEARRERAKRRESLLAGLQTAGLSDPEDVAATSDDTQCEISQEVIIAMHRLLARTPSLMVAVRLADLVGEDQPTNVPGTSDAYPNWRRKLRLPVEEMAESSLFRQIVQGVAAERPKPDHSKQEPLAVNR
ncbi:4-alpha-glucanotransferase [Rhizobium halophilum]|uniref:4-alpha-glucanotransferase n=1 Tax=Rhizobium halophilum TaxID=2846852 RepID=UPI001EFCCC3A|nr:4-alpha-glucanotransferase [Rhizobium halophilum]MCF6369613.1 4-alpha-glucanotransferase [Rhizobium halophilum]